MSQQNHLIKVAKIINVHGIRGAVKVKLFLENAELFSVFKNIYNANGLPVSVTLIQKNKDHWLAKIEGVSDRTNAEFYKGMELFVDRAGFPELEEDEFYLSDLVGFKVLDNQDQQIGKVSAFYEYGDLHLIEIQAENHSFFNLEFTKRAVPKIDQEAKMIWVDLSEKIEIS